jgi:flagellar biosynthesis/type III secretory pathway protein FliH
MNAIDIRNTPGYRIGYEEGYNEGYNKAFEVFREELIKAQQLRPIQILVPKDSKLVDDLSSK